MSASSTSTTLAGRSPLDPGQIFRGVGAGVHVVGGFVPAHLFEDVGVGLLGLVLIVGGGFVLSLRRGPVKR